MPTEREFVEAYVLASDDRTTLLRQAAAIGLLVVSKWDRADAAHNGEVSLTDAAPYGNCTDREASGFTSEANALIRDYVSGMAIASTPPKTRAEWWWEVWQGVVAAFCYSLLLILLAVVVRLGGHDLIDILRDAVKP